MNKVDVAQHLDNIAEDYQKWVKKADYYFTRIRELFATFVPPGSDVLEIGTGSAGVLSSLRPQKGTCIGLSREMVRRAQEEYPELSFKYGGVEQLDGGQKYDYIIIQDVLEHLTDIWATINELHAVGKPTTMVVVSFVNPIWEPILRVGEMLRMKMPEGPHNWMQLDDVVALFRLAGFEIQETGYRVLLPICIPFISDLLNKVAPLVPGLKKLCVVQYLVAKAVPQVLTSRNFSCSVIIPCFNEEENIEKCIRRLPNMGRDTEVIVVDDGSTDGTATVVSQLIGEYENLKLISYWPNRGKGGAVKAGFDAALGDVIMVLDADMAVPPEELPRFFEVIDKGMADFANGTRMIYPQEKQAMRHLHRLGNRIFSLIFTWLLASRVTDTLCGTKALRREDYRHIEMGHCPWGDFDLLIGAAKLGLKIGEMPVHYKARVAGESKMKTFRHGLQLLRMALYGFRKLKWAKIGL
ncbi:MAG: glycosyltransferase [Chloroflexi bacterium]|nr:glycosyltransferase [Chloroflexota bacterium]